MECLHTDASTHIYSCVTYVLFHINDMTSLTLCFAAISAPLSTRYSITGKWQLYAAHINGVYPSWYIHRYTYIHVWLWHHLHYSLPPYQLLSPPNIQPLANDHSLQHTSMECIHSDTFTSMCEGCIKSLDRITSTHISPNSPSRLHLPLVLRPEIELQLNHLVERHHTPIHAWI